jgi:hypothetical protein
MAWRPARLWIVKPSVAGPRVMTAGVHDEF